MVQQPGNDKFEHLVYVRQGYESRSIADEAVEFAVFPAHFIQGIHGPGRLETLEALEKAGTMIFIRSCWQATFHSTSLAQNCFSVKDCRDAEFKATAQTRAITVG